MLLTWLFSNPLLFLAWISAIIVALTIHEFAHALIAYFFGDTTAKRDGRMSLNPAAHIDPVGFLMLILAGFGWAKPVMINIYSFRNPRLATRMISLAGPLINLAAAGVFIIYFKLFMANFSFFGLYLQIFNQQELYADLNLLNVFIFFLVYINTTLAIFNLIPIPPLDGSKVLFSFLPEKYDYLVDKFSLYGPFILIFAVFFGFFNGLFNVVFAFLNHII